MQGQGYSEQYAGGSPEAERLAFETYVQDILRAQDKWEAGRQGVACREVGMTNVILRNSPDLAASPRTGSAFAPWRRVAAG